jgi:hypothetical protein
MEEKKVLDSKRETIRSEIMKSARSLASENGWHEADFSNGKAMDSAIDEILFILDKAGAADCAEAKEPDEVEFLPIPKMASPFKVSDEGFICGDAEYATMADVKKAYSSALGKHGWAAVMINGARFVIDGWNDEFNDALDGRISGIIKSSGSAIGAFLTDSDIEDTMYGACYHTIGNALLTFAGITPVCLAADGDWQ